jgi:hypothetical protein
VRLEFKKINELNATEPEMLKRGTLSKIGTNLRGLFFFPEIAERIHGKTATLSFLRKSHQIRNHDLLRRSEIKIKKKLFKCA